MTQTSLTAANVRHEVARANLNVCRRANRSLMDVRRKRLCVQDRLKRHVNRWSILDLSVDLFELVRLHFEGRHLRRIVQDHANLARTHGEHAAELLEKAKNILNKEPFNERS